MDSHGPDGSSHSQYGDGHQDWVSQHPITTVLDRRHTQSHPTYASAPGHSIPGHASQHVHAAWPSSAPSSDLGPVPFSYLPNRADDVRAHMDPHSRQHSSGSAPLDWTTLPARNYNPAFSPNNNSLFSQLNSSAEASPATSIPSNSSFSFNAGRQTSTHGSPAVASSLTSRRSSLAAWPTIDTVTPPPMSSLESPIAASTGSNRPMSKHATPASTPGPSSLPYQHILPRPTPSAQSAPSVDPISPTLPDHQHHGVRRKSSALPPAIQLHDAQPGYSPLHHSVPGGHQRLDLSPSASMHYSAERRAFVPPSLWMSPTPNATIPQMQQSSSYNNPYASSFSSHDFNSVLGSSARSSTSTGTSMFSMGAGPTSTAPTTANVTRSPSIFSDILSDEFPGKPTGPPPLQSIPSPPPTVNSPQPSNASGGHAEEDPDRMAREDPLATQVWKMYARTKASLPHAQRMENLTWRMMAMALKRKQQRQGSSDDLTGMPTASSAPPTIVCHTIWLPF